ncbi:MAG: hypothetical protein U0796_10190 [Gemmatales bacterium]
MERAKTYRSSWTAEDRLVRDRANSVQLWCLVNRENKREPLYVFYDQATGQQLSCCWKESDWVRAINQAMDKRRERLGLPSFKHNFTEPATHGK